LATLPNQDFKRAITEALVVGGFRLVSKNYRLDGPGSTVIIGIQKSDVDEVWYINVGFWMNDLGVEVPPRVELTHMYFRLERLFPDNTQAIHRGVRLNDIGHPQGLANLKRLLNDEMLPTLHRYAEDRASLRAAFQAQDWMKRGLVTKEVKSILA